MAAWCQTPLALRMVHDPGLTVGPQQVGVSASKALMGVEEVEPLRQFCYDQHDHWVERATISFIDSSRLCSTRIGRSVSTNTARSTSESFGQYHNNYDHHQQQQQ
jgi:hypothetical protein